MSFNLFSAFSLFGTNDRFERRKIALLSLTSLLVICAYTLVYDLKNSIFVSIVGKQYVPHAKMISMFVLIPAVLFYSWLVDRLRKHQLLYFFSISYAVFGIACAYFVAHPTVGLGNTVTHGSRLFGWMFYFIVEGFSPFMVSVFWAFVNSINSPEGAKEHYGQLVAASKLGGIISAGIAWFWLQRIVLSRVVDISHEANHQFLLLIFTFFMLCIPVVVYFLMRTVPSSYLHGYEVVYRFEQKQEREEKQDKQHEKKQDSPSMFSGLKMLLERPYILGIFGMVFFYEVLGSILGYQRLGVAQAVSDSVSGMSAELYRQMFFMHLAGFFISIFGTSALLRRMGERFCLLLIPISSGALLFYFWLTYTPEALVWVFITLKSVNYAFALPVRESLYIPTTKEVRFKSKSWIDAFGSKLARGVGSFINVLSTRVGEAWEMVLHGGVFGIIIGAWLVIAVLLGDRHAKAVKRNEIIG